MALDIWHRITCAQGNTRCVSAYIMREKNEENERKCSGKATRVRQNFRQKSERSHRPDEDLRAFTTLCSTTPHTHHCVDPTARREEKAHGEYLDVGDHSVDLQAEERHVQRAMPNVPTEQRSGSQRRPASGVSESRGRRTVMAVAWWSDRPSIRAVSCSAVRRCRSPRRSEQVCESPMAAPSRRTPKLSFSCCAAWSKVCWSEASRVRGGSRRHRARRRSAAQLGLRPFGFRRAAQLQRGGLLGWSGLRGGSSSGLLGGSGLSGESALLRER